MPEIQVAKRRDGLVPVDEEGRVSLAKLGQGEIITVKWRRVRNIKFHRLHFSCLKFGFDHWFTPDLSHEGDLPPVRDFDSFRKEVMILAGFRRAVWNLDGTFRLEARSISFASMDEDEFQKAHSAVVNVLLATVFKDWVAHDGFNQSELEAAAEEFARRFG